MPNTNIRFHSTGKLLAAKLYDTYVTLVSLFMSSDTPIPPAIVFVYSLVRYARVPLVRYARAPFVYMLHPVPVNCLH